MNITLRPVLSKNKSKIWYTFEWGKAANQRKASGIFTYAKPQTQIEKKHNSEALALLEVKKSELILERQSIGSAYIPSHKFQSNFIDFYEQYVTENRIYGNRHLENSLTQFKAFLGKDILAPIDLNESLALRFRKYLLDRFNGDTPANYFARFKKVVKAATKAGYYRYSPSEDIKAKANKNKKLKDHLEAPEYIQLIRTPCYHEEIREAFILCCYTGLRWCDVKPLDWTDIKGDQLRTRIVQHKTGEPLMITLHPTAKAILEKRRARLKEGISEGKVFQLPSQDGSYKILAQWCKDAGVDKHITWHCARLSFSILLQDKNVDTATVALLLGHTSTKHVLETYKRHRPKDLMEVIKKLPGNFSELESPEHFVEFTN